MRLPVNLLQRVVDHLDPGEGLATTHTLHSLCLCSKVFLGIARPQLYSVLRIDDMRNSLDMSMKAMHRIMRKEDSKVSERSKWWMNLMFRQTEEKINEKKRKEKEEAKKRDKAERVNENSNSYDENMSDSDEEEEEEEEEELYDEEDEDARYNRSDGFFGMDMGYRDSDLPFLNPYNWGPTDILDPFSFAELRSLEAFPHLGQYVKTINFYGRIEGQPTSLIFKRFLKLCPNVETIVLLRGQVRYIESFTTVIDQISQFAPNLTSLTMIDFGEWFDHQFKAIEKLSKLKHLSLTCTPAEGYITELNRRLSNPSLLPKSLTSFHLGSIATPEYYDLIPTSLAQSITSLGVSIRRELPDITRFNNLQHLKITFGYFCQGVNFLRTVKDSQTIKSLELCNSEPIAETEWQERKNERDGFYSDDEDYYYDDSDQDGESGGDKVRRSKVKERELDSILDLFDYLPPNLESLSLLWFLRDPSDKEFKKAIETKLPKSLRSITLLAAMGEDDEEEEEEEEEEEGSWGINKKKRETWLDEISTILENKGVELYRYSEPYRGPQRSGIFRGLTGMSKSK